MTIKKKSESSSLFLSPEQAMALISDMPGRGRVYIRVAGTAEKNIFIFWKHARSLLSEAGIKIVELQHDGNSFWIMGLNEEEVS